MPLVETNGLILRSYNLSDADKIVVFLTPERGLVRGVAKGARRLKSKFGSALEPCTVAEITYTEKEERELVILQHIELVTSYFALASSGGILDRISHLVELLIEFSSPNEGDKRMYRMATATFDVAFNKPELVKPLEMYFEVWLLRLAGFLPVFNSCNACDRDLDDDEPVTLLNDYSVVCTGCRRSGAGGIQVEPNTRHLIDRTKALSPASFGEEVLNREGEVDSVLSITKRLISGILERDIKHA